MTRVGVYCEPSGSSIGGAEYMSALLAEAVSRSHSAELVHHRSDLTKTQLSRLFGLNLQSVSFRYEPGDIRASYRAHLDSWHQRRSWRRELSESYDVFVNITHSPPPYCHARRHGILVVLFPFFNRLDEWPWKESVDSFSSRLRREYYEWDWRQRLRSYKEVLSISEFTRNWTKVFWGVESHVAYPPVPAPPTTAQTKEKLIISVGRFSNSGHPKCHLEMIEAFASIATSVPHWHYECIGAVSRSAEDQAYLGRIQQRIDRRMDVRANLSRRELHNAYARASVFVHATGLGTQDNRPELSEHFGISTVEAMAAGCVPLVIGKGAQPEIVQHGVNGFVWHSLPELKEYLRLVMLDDQLRARLSVAARSRAAVFSEGPFIDRMMRLIDIAPT